MGPNLRQRLVPLPGELTFLFVRNATLAVTVHGFRSRYDLPFAAMIPSRDLMEYCTTAGSR